MATLEIARNSWWNKMTREEQEEYLRTHKRSKLKINKRRSKKSKKDGKDKTAAPKGGDDGKAEEKDITGTKAEPVADKVDAPEADAPKPDIDPRKFARKLGVNLKLGRTKKMGYEIHDLENNTGDKDGERKVVEAVMAKSRKDGIPVSMEPTTAAHTKLLKELGFKDHPRY